MARRHLRLEVYSIHGHLPTNSLLDYNALFEEMTKLKGHHQQEGFRHIAIGTTTMANGRLFFAAYTGNSDKSLLFFDVHQQAEHAEVTAPGRFQARKTHIMLDANLRRLIIDAKLGNLTANELAQLIEVRTQAIPAFAGLELSFTPRIDTEFVKEIDQLQRIQAATVTLARPNVDWTERRNELTQFADDSEATALDVTVRAKRGKSLARNNGLVGFVKNFASDPLSIFKKISIVGEREPKSGLITLNLSKHVEHIDLNLKTDPATGRVNEQEVKLQMDAYLNGQEL